MSRYLRTFAVHPLAENDRLWSVPSIIGTLGGQPSIGGAEKFDAQLVMQRGQFLQLPPLVPPHRSPSLHPTPSRDSRALALKHLRINRGLHGGAIAGADDGFGVDELFEFGEVGV